MKKLILAAFAYAVISQFVHMLGASVDMPYYTNPAYFGLWSPIMMPGPQPPGAGFYALSIIVALVTGLIFAYAYKISKQAFIAKKSFRSDKSWMVGLRFGFYLFVLTGLTSMLAMYLLLAIPFGLLISWAIQGLIASLAAGVAFAKIMG